MAPKKNKKAKSLAIRELPEATSSLSNGGPSNYRQWGSKKKGERFASCFKSPTIKVLVGPADSAVAFYLHKEWLARRCPYFAGLLSFPGAEADTNSVSLDDPVDIVLAFEMFVDHLYHKSYRTPTELDHNERCLLHARVYVLAGRLLVESLKAEALKRMVDDLASACKVDTGFFMSSSLQTLGKTLAVDTVVEIVELVYENTPNTYAEDDNEKADSAYELFASSSKGKQREGGVGHCGENEVEACPPDAPTVEEAWPTIEETVPDGMVADTGWDGPEPENLAEEATAGVPAPEAEGVSDPLPPRDKMRKLISRYAASQLDVYTRRAKFLALVRSQEEFAEDLILASTKGTKIGVDELDRL